MSCQINSKSMCFMVRTRKVLISLEAMILSSRRFRPSLQSGESRPKSMEILTSSSRSIGTESSLTKVSSVPSTITTILRPSSAHYSKPKKLSCSIMLCPPIFKQMDNHRHANSKQAYRPCKSCQILANLSLLGTRKF